jgi:FkbM family methyltransferase
MTFVRADGLYWVMDGPHTDDHLGPAPHEANLEPVLRGLLGQGRVFLDVGAHVGRWSLRLAGQASKVIAVEANPATAVVLRANIAINHLEHKVAVFEVAAWDRAELLRLEDPNGKERGGSTRVLPADRGGPAIQAGPLDWLLADEPEIGLVKLDVEGADLHALRGMRGLLARTRPSLFIERHDQYGYYHVDELYLLLASMDYDWQDGPTYMGAKYLICQPAETPHWGAEVTD